MLSDYIPHPPSLVDLHGLCSNLAICLPLHTPIWPSWSFTVLHPCPQRLVQKMVPEQSRSSKSPTLRFNELELERVKTKKQTLFSVLKAGREGVWVFQLPCPCLPGEILSPERESSTDAKRHSILSPPITSMPFTLMGGIQSPFAYASLRWDSDTTKKSQFVTIPFLKASPYISCKEKLSETGQKEPKFSTDNKTACPLQVYPIPFSKCPVLLSIRGDYHYKGLKTRTRLLGCMPSILSMTKPGVLNRT